MVSVLGNLWYTNRGPFQGNRVAGVPSGHMRVDHPQTGHFDLISLMLANYGGVSYNFYGSRVHVYIAYYERDELVLRELVTGISTAEPYQLSGSMVWGITTEGGARRELRAMASIGGGVASSYFDFSQLDFNYGSSAGGWATLEDTRIELGHRYVLRIWQTGTTFWTHADFFDPEVLRESEQTAILYIVFE